MIKKEIEQIAYIENDFKEKFGIPRQSGRAKSVLSKIKFLKKYRDFNAIRGLDGFSHLWLIFGFSECENKEFSPLVRPPRLGGNQKMGVFASRSPFRPNGLGLSSVKIEKIVLDDVDSPYIMVSGADLMNNSPIYDIKPYLPQSDCHINAKGGFSEEHLDYKLSVTFLNDCQNMIDKNKLAGIIECLEDDPRPSYQSDDRIYGMTFGEYNIKFNVKDQILQVLNVEKSNN